MPQLVFSIARFLAEPDDDALIRRLTAALSDIASFDAWRLVRFVGDEAPVLIEADDHARPVEAYLKRFYHDDPFYHAIEAGSFGEMKTLAEVEPRNLRYSEYFRDHLEAGAGFADQIGYACSTDRNQVWLLTLTRSANFKPFRASEIARFRKVAPLVRSALMMAWARIETSDAPATGAMVSAPDDAPVPAPLPDIVMHSFGATALSPREQEILTLILSGASAKTIARDLDISAGTAQCHIKNIYLKLGVSSRGELFARFVSQLIEQQHAA